MQDVYEPEDVARHNHANDLWITISGNVYDLTKFLKQHPGGEEVLLGLAGRDGTKSFNGVGHSEEALLLRGKFKIGRLEREINEDANETLDRMDKADESMKKDSDDWQPHESKTRKLHWFLPWIILSVSFSVYIINFALYYNN